MGREVITYWCVLVVMFASTVTCDIAKDKAECANQLVGLATCLPYVGGEAKTPTMDCCTGLTQLIKTNKKCLCILIKDKDDPSVGIKINTTLALGLPTKCNSPKDTVSECPALLHLPPNSPESKVFSDFGKGVSATAASNATTSPATATPSESSGTSMAKGPTNAGGVVAKEGLILQMLYGVLLSGLILYLKF